MKKCASKEFIEFCDDRYPGLKNNVHYRRFFFYLLFGTYRDTYDDDDDTRNGNLLLSRKKLLTILGKNQLDHNTKVIIFLRAFKRDVLPNFVWNEYEKPDPNSWDYGKCRTVKNHGIDTETWDMARKEIGNKGTRYYFETRRSFSGTTKVRERANIADEYKELIPKFNLNPTQQLILDRLNISSIDKGGEIFSRKLTQNRELVEKAIAELQPKPTDVMTLQEKKELQFNILGSIEEDGRVFYRPTPLCRTPRLHHASECVLSLKSDVRKALCHGWIDADLVSSQLCIMAAVVNAPITKAFLQSGQHIWTYLNGGTKPSSDEKKVFKSLVYGICFGTSEKPNRYSIQSLQEILESINRVDLLNDPIIRELLDLRSQWFDRIRKDGYVNDVWGNKHILEKKGLKQTIYGGKVKAKERWAGSLAGTMIQSIEMEIISGAFEYDRDHSDRQKFRIVLFQHDGFTLSVTDPAKFPAIEKGLQKAVKDKANKVGTQLGLDLDTMKLEFTEL